MRYENAKGKLAKAKLAERFPIFRSFSFHVFGTFSVRLLQAANSILTGIIIARWLGSVALGVYSVLSVTMQIAVHFSGGGIYAANTYFVLQDRRRIKSAIVNGLLFALISGSVVAFSLIIAAFIESQFFRGIAPALVALACVSIPLQLINLLGINFFLAMGRLRALNSLDLGSQGVVLIGALIGVVLLHKDLWTLYVVNNILYLTVTLLAVIFVSSAARDFSRDLHPLKWRADFNLFKNMLRYGFRYQVMWLARMLTLRADLLVVNLFHGAGEAGVYVVATQGSLMLTILPNVIGNLIFPHITAKNDTSGEITCRVMRYAALIMLIACALSAPLCFFLPLLYGAKFADVPTQFLLLLPGTYTLSLESVLIAHFVGTGLPPRVTVFWVGTALFNLISNLFVVPMWGARGAAVVSSCSYILAFVLLTYHFLSLTRKSFREMFFIRKEEMLRLLKWAAQANVRGSEYKVT